MPHPWDVASDEIKLTTWRAALVAAKGNITHAAAAVGINRSHATRLMTRYGLHEYAAQLRLAVGYARVVDGKSKGLVTGRPPRR